jgi:hypothetical protein
MGEAWGTKGPSERKVGLQVFGPDPSLARPCSPGTLKRQFSYEIHFEEYVGEVWCAMELHRVRTIRGSETQNLVSVSPTPPFHISVLRESPQSSGDIGHTHPQHAAHTAEYVDGVWAEDRTGAEYTVCESWRRRRGRRAAT